MASCGCSFTQSVRTVVELPPVDNTRPCRPTPASDRGGLTDARHLPPEEAAEAGEGVGAVVVGAGLFGGEAEGGGELGVRRRDVFVAVALGEPAVEDAGDGAALQIGRASCREGV